MSVALGIDLGTTYSSVCFISNGSINIIGDLLNDKYIPSILGLQITNNKLVFHVGQDAKSHKKLIFDSKRMLGQRYDDENIQSMINKWPFKIIESESGGILICIEDKGKKYTFEPYQISGEILKYLAEVGNQRNETKERVRDVVITVPANFGDKQRQETLKAAEYANLNVLQLINEPTAAGIAYVNDPLNKGERYVLIFDFGGGTLDVSLIHINKQSITVSGTDGDMFLGGRDFDERTTEYLIKKFVLGQLPPKKKFMFSELVRDAKERLSINRNESVSIDLSYFVKKRSSAEEEDEEEEDSTVGVLELSEFEMINEDLFGRILLPIERLLEKTGIAKEEIDSIILVGGSSKMKMVKKILTTFFEKEPIHRIDPNDAVVTGAGIIAAKLSNGESLPFKLRNLEYKDVCPYSIGTLLYDGTFSKIINGNSDIPISRHEHYSSVIYGQKSFDIVILEGDNENAKDNKYLGMFTIPNLPFSEEEISFVITFDLRKNGVLYASARIDNSDIQKGIEIPIKRTNQHSLDPKYFMSEFDIFYQSIENFIHHNKNSLINDPNYSKSEINNIWMKIQKEKKNKEDYPESSKILAFYYRDKVFKKYFSSHPIPKFLW